MEGCLGIVVAEQQAVSRLCHNALHLLGRSNFASALANGVGMFLALIR